jgi:hypothetical protein
VVTDENTAMGTVGAVETYVVRVWLPDRPGALGQVASRIGAVRGDVVGIDILERGGGQAVDELVVTVPDGSVIDLLAGEIAQVDGVAVEDIRRVSGDRPDPGLWGLEIAAELAEAPASTRLDELCRQLTVLVEATWAVAFDAGERRALVERGDAPDTGWLAAFIHGSRHLSDDEQAAGAPGDLAWGRLEGTDIVVAIGRAGRPIHTRERQQVTLLCRLTAALLVERTVTPA